jgi:hypothetical protein
MGKDIVVVTAYCDIKSTSPSPMQSREVSGAGPAMPLIGYQPAKCQKLISIGWQHLERGDGVGLRLAEQFKWKTEPLRTMSNVKVHKYFGDILSEIKIRFVCVNGFNIIPQVRI